MAELDVLSAFPKTLRASTTQPKVLYRRLPGLIAIHDRDEPPEGWPLVLRLDDPPILVCRVAAGAVPRQRLQGTLTPVYAPARGSTPAVPTGLVLVRFREGILAADRGALFLGRGYAIQDVLAYAPNAAWLRAASGGIPAALASIAALESLPDVVNVEPQMVTRRAQR